MITSKQSHAGDPDALGSTRRLVDRPSLDCLKSWVSMIASRSFINPKRCKSGPKG